MILATGPPFASFGLANRLGRRLNRPYVLDYRDLWTGNPHATRPAPQRTSDKERTALAGSAAALGVSPSLVQSLRQQFGMQEASYAISNGFDPEELARAPKQVFGHFAIVYTGAFYPPKRTVGPLMAALQRADRRNGTKREWMFHYYGHQADYVRKAARDFGLEHKVVIHGSVTRPGALAAMWGANIAVVISSVYEHGSLEDKGIVTGKIFDAIGVGAPLLVIAPKGSDLDGILAVTGLGQRFAGTEVDQIAEFLRNAMNGGAPRALKREPFSWAIIVEELDRALRDALGAKH